MTRLQWVNIVANASVGQPLDVRSLVYAIPGRYGKKVFPAAVCKVFDPKATISAFASGELVLAGAKTEMDALKAAYMYVTALKKRLNLQNVHLYNFRITNMVCILTLGYDINVDLFYDDHQFSCTFKPDKFAGLAWRTTASPVGRKSYEPEKLTFVLFASGKAVVSGLKHRVQQSEMVAKLSSMGIYEHGKEYRKLENSRKRTRKRKDKADNEWE
jgi:transcription initiation factor TFIID TATA-box-binding protein